MIVLNRGSFGGDLVGLQDQGRGLVLRGPGKTGGGGGVKMECCCNTVVI